MQTGYAHTALTKGKDFKVWDGGVAAPGTVRQGGKGWMQGGTPILFSFFLTVGEQFWILALGTGRPCPGTALVVHCTINKTALSVF